MRAVKWRHSSEARATGSYPVGRGFKSNCRYQYYGPVVKRLRHRPFTAVTRVRFPFGSPKGGRTQTCHALQKINFRLPVPCRLKSARMSARRGFGKTKISLFVRAKRFCRRVFRAVKREFAARLAPCKNERNAARIKAASETVTRFASCHPMGV